GGGGGGDNECDPGEAPDVIVGDLYDIRRWGETSDGYTGFSVATDSCNVGTCWLKWFNATTEKPVIAQHAFRMMDGRFMQIGQSWLKHGFTALALDTCSPDCIEPPDGSHLGVNCSDPYSASLNGTQTRLGPKFEVNATSGVYNWPPAMFDDEGDAAFKRLAVKNSDLDPNENAGALYFVEGQYVTLDDAEAGNGNNNSSYRRVEVVETRGGFDMDLVFGDDAFRTVRERAALFAWADHDPDVTIHSFEDPDTGLFHAAVKVTDNGDGTWHYEYAVQNQTSHLSGASFSIPVGDSLTPSNLFFYSVDYHSGEPYTNLPWTAEVVDGMLTWSTEAFADNENANALRWGTIYNFAFDFPGAPENGDGGLGLFRPFGDGTVGSLGFPTLVPATTSPCNNDGSCDPDENCIGCPDDCEGIGPDADGDGVNVCFDCDDTSGVVWARPGAVQDLRIDMTAEGSRLDWGQPDPPGGLLPSFGVVRSTDPRFGTLECLHDGSGVSSLLDTDLPATGELYHYLARASNACGLGFGPVGSSSDGTERVLPDCP
ncbi:MAG: hypothetical protein AAF533_26290, partial [Acidobacteriota bacterium]